MSDGSLAAWSRQAAKFPYTDTHKAEALRVADRLGTRPIAKGPHKGKIQRPWTEITRELKQVCPELRELNDHRLRGAVNRWLDADVRERERLYQEERRAAMKEDEKAALLQQKRAYAQDPEIREMINERERNRKAERADIRITSNFRSRFHALLKGAELGAHEYGFSFSKAEALYLPVVQALAGELDAANAEYPETQWVIDHKRPLASYPLVLRVDFLQDAWCPRNLAVISQSENSKKSSIWMGRRWTYASLDGDECFAVACEDWRRKHNPQTWPAIQLPYHQDRWKDHEHVLKVAGRAQQEKLKLSANREKIRIFFENQLLHQRHLEPVGITLESPFSVFTAWAAPEEAELQYTEEFVKASKDSDLRLERQERETALLRRSGLPLDTSGLKFC